MMSIFESNGLKFPDRAHAQTLQFYNGQLRMGVKNDPRKSPKIMVKYGN